MALAQRTKEVYKYHYPSKQTVLKKLIKDTNQMVKRNIINLLEVDKIGEVSIEEVRNRLSKIKKPLSQEIINERENF